MANYDTHLVIKGDIAAATLAARLRGIRLTSAYGHPRFNETMATCSQSNYQRVIAWFCDAKAGHSAPYPVGTLLHYS